MNTQEHIAMDIGTIGAGAARCKSEWYVSDGEFKLKTVPIRFPGTKEV